MKDSSSSRRSPVPNDTAHKVIAVSSHHASQAKENNKNQNLSSIMEDKSRRFNTSERFSGQSMFCDETSDETRVPCKGDDKPRCDANQAFQVRSRPAPDIGAGKQLILNDPQDMATISTMGNISNVISKAEKEASAAIATKKIKPEKRVSYYADEQMNQPWVIQQCPNEPHPLLEFPPLYFLVKSCPGLLKAIKELYSFRWRMTYPLQRRVFLSQALRKAGIFCTYGELLLVLPMVAIFIASILFSFVWPSVHWSGHFARIPLIFALATAMRNSIITLLIGLPFERALWYHKVFGRMAFFGGVLHTIVAHADSLEQAFNKFLFLDTMNSSGTGLLLLIAGVTITSFPKVRRMWFELFYYVHVSFVVLMTSCAFYHSGILIPILASVLWGGDLICRKLIMAAYLYPRQARIRIISSDVVELSFPKTQSFNYNAGQHLSIAVPEIVGAGLEFHPFSIATCPRQPNVSIMVRVAGDWTRALHKLAKEMSEVTVLIEGPNGSPNIDIFSNRYKSYLLFSGGIGITPIQSLCNQLLYEFNKGKRELEKVRVCWTERDPLSVEGTDVVRRASTSCHFQPEVDLEDLDLRSICSNSVFNDGKSQTTDIASTLLALVPASRRTDAELEQDYPIPSGDMQRKEPQREKARKKEGGPSDESTFRGAFNNPALKDILDMQVYITSKQANQALSSVPFVYQGRPDVDQIFADMREEAIQSGLSRVAVIVCAPARLAQVLQVACVKYSDADCQFDLHTEYQD